MTERIYNNYLDTFVLKLDPKFTMEDHVIKHGVWESPSVWVFEQVIKAGFICVDIGANAGLLSLAMAKYTGQSGQVFCFEPANAIYPRLVDNINLNPLWRQTLIHEKMGLGEHDGYFILEEQGGGNGQIVRRYEQSSPEFEGDLCIVTTLDKLFGNQKVNFLKVDVEGMELEVFKGGINLIRAQLPFIWYESEIEHGWFDPQKVKACEDLLRAEGYDLFKVHPDRKLIPVSYPDYEVNSLAVHQSKMGAIAHLIM